MAELDIQAQLAEAKKRKWDDRTLAQRAADMAQELLLTSLKAIRSDERTLISALARLATDKKNLSFVQELCSSVFHAASPAEQAESLRRLLADHGGDTQGDHHTLEVDPRQIVHRMVEVVAAGDPKDLVIEHLGSTWVVTGTWLERLLMNINFDDYESRNYFDMMLRKCGLFARLEEMGIQDGDVVDLYDMQFEYQR